MQIRSFFDPVEKIQGCKTGLSTTLRAPARPRSEVQACFCVFVALVFILTVRLRLLLALSHPASPLIFSSAHLVTALTCVYAFYVLSV
jgi:hypothetical protein